MTAFIEYKLMYFFYIVPPNVLPNTVIDVSGVDYPVRNKTHLHTCMYVCACIHN